MDDKGLRVTATVFLTALLVHGADHFLRGIEVPSRLSVVGGMQFLAGVLAVALVLRRHRLAPLAAVVVGFGSALLFTTGHLLPSGTEPFTGARAVDGITAFSWFAALFEIAADLAFGWAGAVALRSAGGRWPSGSARAGSTAGASAAPR